MRRGPVAALGFFVLLAGGVVVALVLVDARPEPPKAQQQEAQKQAEGAAVEEGLRMVAERVRCEPARLASLGQPLWARLQALAGCAHRQERKIDALESELARLGEADRLERAYWAHLSRAGLTRQIRHVPSGAAR